MISVAVSIFYNYVWIWTIRRLNKIFPKQLLLEVYKSYIQSKLDYGLSIGGCTTEANQVECKECKIVVLEL